VVFFFFFFFFFFADVNHHQKVEITSKFDGIVTKLHTAKGGMANVGHPLVDIDVADAAVAAKAIAQDAHHHAPAAAAAPTAASAAPAAPTVAKSNVSSPSSPSPPAAAAVVRKERHEILTTPAVRRLARENNVDLAIVPGSGKDGRILKEDMLAYIAAPRAAAAAVAAPATGVAAVVQRGEWREPVRGVLRTMIKTMTAAAHVPHLGYCDEIQMDNLMALRARLKPIAEKRGVALSFLPFMLKAASLALHQYPLLNARLSPDGTELIHRGAHNIGFALASAEGLLVPNVKNVDQLSVFEIASELARIIEAGRTGRLPPSDLSGGSLTLSNIGTVGGTYTSPVLLLPEVVIGAFGKTQRLPRFDANDKVVPVNIMNVSWSADHRIVDGMTIASFSNVFKGLLEEPGTMILDLK
jgi:2-oxoisovalerate dehydrogenase E2 component (dihydrolipoyl transacylase)